MKTNFKQKDIEEYILSHIEALQSIFDSFNYPNLSNFMKVIKTEFKWQSMVTNYIQKNRPIKPVVIDLKS